MFSSGGFQFLLMFFIRLVVVFRVFCLNSLSLLKSHFFMVFASTAGFIVSFSFVSVLFSVLFFL